MSKRRQYPVKLSYEKAQEIRRVYESGKCTVLTLARCYGVSDKTIYHILAGETWLTPEMKAIKSAELKSLRIKCNAIKEIPHEDTNYFTRTGVYIGNG